MCSEGDLKDLGLPMGPRKKLKGLLQEEQSKRVNNTAFSVSTLNDIESEKKSINQLKAESIL